MTREHRLRAEAAVYLLVAWAALKVVPFRRLRWIFERSPRGPEPVGTARDQARRDVRRAVHHTALMLPGMVCFPKAIAAQAMLRRRGIPTTLYWGGTMVPRAGLAGHAWLQDGETGVVGQSASRGYSALATFSPFGHKGAT